MTTSEPTTAKDANALTTGEIVRALRVCDVGRCIDCNIDEKYPCENLKTYAADRLKSQEQTIATLTARAEQAERERDAMVKSVDRLVEAWENFKSPALIEFLKQWRELPQEGEQNNGQANNDHLR